MKIKSRNYFIALGILLVGFALFAFRGPDLELRQPRSGTPVHPVTKQFLLKKNTALAKTTAESLGRQALGLIEASTTPAWQRWWRGVNLSKLESQYRHDVKIHMQAIAEVMRLRRENGGSLTKLYEFDFQNLLRKSDSILSSRLTRDHLHLVAPELLQAYKSERKFTSLRPLVASY